MTKAGLTACRRILRALRWTKDSKRPYQPRTVKRHLIIFTRYPEPHRTKTRLIPRLGPEGAAELQGQMTAHTLAWARELANTRPVSVQVRFAGGDEPRMQQHFGDDLQYLPQGGGDLGCRMIRAMDDVFALGADRVIIVGTDCPGITGDLTWQAFDRLDSADLVLGPAVDGGYYLIGLRRPETCVFEGIPWGQSTVLRDTLQRARERGLKTFQLEPLSDVDRPEDLAVWEKAKFVASDGSGRPRVSVIIPALNEVDYLEDTLAALKCAPDVETIVVDGGSCDGTDSIALRQDVKLIRASNGRAGQMNSGAHAATGDMLVFLHADTRLPERFEEHVRKVLSRTGVVAGAFRLRIDGSRPVHRLIEWAVNQRSRLLQMPYGDQAIFLRAETFRRLGGFPELPIMEDFEFIRRLRRNGRVAIATASATTSARRWNQLGPWRTTWINQRIILGYHLGISPNTLAKWYSGSRLRP